MSDEPAYRESGPGVDSTAHRNDGGREDRQSGREFVRRAVGSGSVAVGLGGILVLRGLRALRRGDRRRGIVRLALGALVAAAAATQRRRAGREGANTGAERVDVGPAGTTDVDVEDVERAGETARERHDAATHTDVPEEYEGDEGMAEDYEAAKAVETATEPTDDRSASGESPTGLDGDSPAEGAYGDADGADAVTRPDTAEAPTVGDPDEYDRLGSAALDGQSGRVPAPQRAFNQSYLARNSEAYWGIRESDDAVVVSDRYDPIVDLAGVRYVASSQVEGERLLKVPDTVLDHWDEVSGGGDAVVGGDDIVFATGDGLRDHRQLVVVPGQWADDVLGEVDAS